MDKTSEMAGKVTGKAKQAKQVMAGRTGIFSTLAEDHGEVAALLKRAKNTDTDSADGLAERRSLFAEIKSQLLAHAKAEEAEFYSPLAQNPETRALIQESTSEHRELEAILEELNATDLSSAVWLGLLEQLEDTVQHHVDEEENALFPKAQKILSHDEAKHMDTRFQTLKATELHRLQG